MNLFRSEEHVRNWPQFAPSSGEGILDLQDLVRLFSVDHVRRRLDPDYLSNGMYVQSFVQEVVKLAEARPFWSLPAAPMA